MLALNAIAVVVVGIAVYLVGRMLLGGGSSLFLAFRLNEPLEYINGEAGLLLIRKPRRPEALPALTLRLGVSRAPESWRDYLFWDLSWDGPTS